MRIILYRLFYLLLGWSWVGFIYNLTDKLQSTGQRLTPSAIDLLVPFNAHAIWPYLSFFLIISFAFLYAPYQRIRWMSLSMILMSTLAGTCYLLFPTTIDYPTINDINLSSRLLQHLIQVDSSQNCFPSLHVALTLIATASCLRVKRNLMNILLIIWSVVICLSIIVLRRHLFIDLLGGSLLALAIGYLMSRLLYAKPRTVND